LVIFDPQYKNTSQTARHIQQNYHALPNINQDEINIIEFVKEIERVLVPSGFLLFWIDDQILLKKNYLNWLPRNLQLIEILVWSKGKYVGLGINYFRKNCEFALLIQKKPLIKKVKDKGIRNFFSEIVNFELRHNTREKPYKMTKKIIQQLTNKGDLVVDPCAGSFVSLIACQKLERDFLGTDLTLRELMKFNINKENSRELLKKELVF